mmetsp:Transcript_85274/g.275213  ORF Transcript_85274/g.275213 Transcript_85274/m.275213 type:complete len:201 (+) Transcript_85274:1985-2587(+)
MAVPSSRRPAPPRPQRKRPRWRAPSLLSFPSPALNAATPTSLTKLQLAMSKWSFVNCLNLPMESPNPCKPQSPKAVLWKASLISVMPTAEPNPRPKPWASRSVKPVQPDKLSSSLANRLRRPMFSPRHLRPPLPPRPAVSSRLRTSIESWASSPKPPASSHRSRSVALLHWFRFSANISNLVNRLSPSPKPYTRDHLQKE